MNEITDHENTKPVKKISKSQKIESLVMSLVIGLLAVFLVQKIEHNNDSWLVECLGFLLLTCLTNLLLLNSIKEFIIKRINAYFLLLFFPLVLCLLNLFYFKPTLVAENQHRLILFFIGYVINILYAVTICTFIARTVQTSHALYFFTTLFKSQLFLLLSSKMSMFANGLIMIVLVVIIKSEALIVLILCSYVCFLAKFNLNFYAMPNFFEAVMNIVKMINAIFYPLFLALMILVGVLCNYSLVLALIKNHHILLTSFEAATSLYDLSHLISKIFIVSLLLNSSALISNSTKTLMTRMTVFGLFIFLLMILLSASVYFQSIKISILTIFQLLAMFEYFILMFIGGLLLVSFYTGHVSNQIIHSLIPDFIVSMRQKQIIISPLSLTYQVRVLLNRLFFFIFCSTSLFFIILLFVPQVFNGPSHSSLDENRLTKHLLEGVLGDEIIQPFDEIIFVPNDLNLTSVQKNSIKNFVKKELNYQCQLSLSEEALDTTELVTQENYSTTPDVCFIFPLVSSDKRQVYYGLSVLKYYTSNLEVNSLFKIDEKGEIREVALREQKNNECIFYRTHVNFETKNKISKKDIENYQQRLINDLSLITIPSYQLTLNGQKIPLIEIGCKSLPLNHKD